MTDTNENPVLKITIRTTSEPIEDLPDGHYRGRVHFNGEKGLCYFDISIAKGDVPSEIKVPVDPGQH